MIDETLATQLARLTESAQSIIIVLDKAVNYDQAASAIALSQAFDQAGKEVKLVSPKIPPGLDQLSEYNRLGKEMGHQSLTISFDYSEEKVDKISYHIGEEAGKFYLTVKPKAGVEPLDPDTVEYSYTGAQADLLILVGVSDLEDLDQLYFGYEELYRNTSMISIHSFETEFGTVKIDTSALATNAEFVVSMLDSLHFPISADAATNLLAGIEQATGRFQSRSITASTFETIAKLMNLGARRILPPLQAIDQPASIPSSVIPGNQEKVLVGTESSKPGTNKKKKRASLPQQSQDAKPGSKSFQPSMNRS